LAIHKLSFWHDEFAKIIGIKNLNLDGIEPSGVEPLTPVCRTDHQSSYNGVLQLFLLISSQSYHYLN